jgi:hypothetical protein
VFGLSEMDLCATLGAALVGVAFVLGRFGEVLFVVPGLAVVAGAAVVALGRASAPAEGVLLVAGLFLLFWGLLILRVILHRSVSLRMLARLLEGGLGSEGREDIRGRLADVERFGLVAATAGAYRLTAFGQVVAATVATLYRVTNAGA